VVAEEAVQEWAETVVLAAALLRAIVILQQLLVDITVVIVRLVLVPQVLAKLGNHMATEPTAIYRPAATAVTSEQIMPGLVYTDMVLATKQAATNQGKYQEAEPVESPGRKDKDLVPVD
jgi:hypothetical protein